MVIVEGEPRSLYLVLPRASVTVNVMRRRPRRQLSKERQNGALYCDLRATGRTDIAGITSRRTLLSSQGLTGFRAYSHVVVREWAETFGESVPCGVGNALGPRTPRRRDRQGHRAEMHVLKYPCQLPLSMRGTRKCYVVSCWKQT